jgi:hypothetical protein
VDRRNVHALLWKALEVLSHNGRKVAAADANIRQFTIAQA